eukprot:XP_016659753.1 PREDICTED: activating signal cointegrator 1-like [Acyrthosiphon pisum]
MFIENYLIYFYWILFILKKKKESKPKNNKYVNIYTDEGVNQQEVFFKVVKGRRNCNFRASRHGLVNNCLGCGRVVCKQVGSGPCIKWW